MCEYDQRMARIVMSAWGSFGDVYPYVGLALGLRARGHHPVLAVPGLYREIVEREGIRFRPVRPDLEIHNRALAARVMDPVRGSHAILAEILIPSLTDSFADLDAAASEADLLITHPAALAGPIVADARRLGWVSTVLAPLSFFSVEDPVVPPPAPWIHALTSRSRLLSRAFRWQTERLTGRWTVPIQRFRELQGLRRGGNPILDAQHSPHLVLALFSRLLADPQPDWPRPVSMTGPILYNGSDAQALAPDLAAFLDAGEPPIVFTLGTSAVGAAGSFYEVSAEVVRRLRRRAVLLVGPYAENRPAHIDESLHLAEFAPHAALFARAAAVVHQGGVGTLHQALASGRPTLVVPHAHDQPDNAYRVQRLGVSRTLYPKHYCPAAVERELRHLLDEPRYRRRAAEVGLIVRGENGVASACDAIESVLQPRAAGATSADPAAGARMPRDC